MRVFGDARIWLGGGLRDGRWAFWATWVLYGVFLWMIKVREFAPLDVSTGSVLTLQVFAMCEASVQFAKWCVLKGDHPYARELALWGSWGRQIAATHALLVWVTILTFNGAPPLPAMLVMLGTTVFGLAKTLPGLKVEGRIANTLFAAMVAIPLLIVAAIGHVAGL